MGKAETTNPLIVRGPFQRDIIEKGPKSDPRGRGEARSAIAPLSWPISLKVYYLLERLEATHESREEGHADEGMVGIGAASVHLVLGSLEKVCSRM